MGEDVSLDLTLFCYFAGGGVPPLLNRPPFFIFCCFSLSVSSSVAIVNVLDLVHVVHVLVLLLFFL